MSGESKDKSDKSTDIKNAAALLLKGGTLISEPCSECRGVQVRFKENITCVNCGNKQRTTNVSNSKRIQNEHTSLTSSPERVQIELGPARFIFQDKILTLASEIRDETDLAIQKQKADLIDTYLTILQKIHTIINLISQS